MITVTQIHPKHSVDDGTIVVAAIYLTADHSLMITGICAKCGMKDVTILVPLSDLWKQCPEPPKERFTIRDIGWLKSQHITLEPKGTT